MKSIHHVILAISLVLGESRAAEPVAVPQPPIEVTGAKGHYDYLDTDTKNGRLLAGHPANGTFEIFDLESGKLIKSLPLGAAQGAVYDSLHDRYYVTLSKEQKVVAVDAKNFQSIAEIPVSGPADGILYNNKTQCVYAGHDDGNEAWIIDTNTNKLKATAKLSGNGPEGSAINETGQIYFQNVKESHTLDSINALTGEALKSWPVDPAQKPHGLIYDEKNHHLLVSGGNGTFVMMDAETGKVLTSLQMSPGVDQTAFNKATNRLYCPSGRAGTLTVIQIHPDSAEVIGVVPIDHGVHTIALDPQNNAAWIAYGDDTKSFIRKLKLL
jgi:DNA-binding beta-propeller fold protein YncE